MLPELQDEKIQTSLLNQLKEISISDFTNVTVSLKNSSSTKSILEKHKNVLIEKGILMKATTNGSKFGLEIVPGNSGVSLGEFNVPEGEKVEKGMIIELNKLAGEEVDLYDKKTGNIFAKGEVVVIDENFGVRVTEVLDKSLEEPKEEK